MLEQERDRIWAAAVAAYNSGEQWWLTPEEDELLAQANKNWQSSDSWEADVLNYLQDKLICTVSELLTKVIQIELAKQNRAEQMRLSDILRRNGWVKASKQKRIEGKAQWYWEKVMTGCDKVMTEVMTSSNPCSTTLLAEMSQPVITFTPNNHPELPTHPRHHILIKNQRMGGDVSEQSLNQGCDTSSDNSQNLVEQELEGVITSPNQGCDTPLKLEKITDEDAQKLRDLALLWWPEYYPGQMQTLQSQMYGWSAPGTRYDVTVIAEWLESQDELIRDRLTELINLRES